jgi:hypothetical protein
MYERDRNNLYSAPSSDTFIPLYVCNGARANSNYHAVSKEHCTRYGPDLREICGQSKLTVLP